MNDKTASARLARLVDDVARLDVAVASGLFDRIRGDFAGQLRSPSFDAGSGTDLSRVTSDDDLPPDHSDPTGAAAVAAAMRGGGKAEAALRSLHHDIDAAFRAIDNAVRTAARWNARASTAADRALVAKENRQSERGCQSCARVPTRGDAGRPKDQRTAWWNEVFKTTMIDDKPVDLCRWCWEGEVGVKRTGALPAIVDIESYRDTGRARRRAS